MAGKKESANNSGIRIEDITYSFKQLLERKLSELPENFSILLLVSGEEYSEVILALVEALGTDRQLKGVYLTANKQSEMLLQLFRKRIPKFDSKKMFFLDCVSKNLATQNIENAVECSPQNLIDLNIALNQALDVIEEGGFMILDSIATLAIYNDERTLKKFVKTVVEKCYSRKVKGIFICNNSKSMKELIEDIGPFFNQTIDSERL